MLASKLVEKLQKLIKKHGDANVIFIDPEWETTNHVNKFYKEKMTYGHVDVLNGRFKFGDVLFVIE